MMYLAEVQLRNLTDIARQPVSMKLTLYSLARVWSNCLIKFKWLKIRERIDN